MTDTDRRTAREASGGQRGWALFPSTGATRASTGRRRRRSACPVIV